MPRRSDAFDCDVVVCGAGPVGQLLAHHLGALGVDTIAVDAAPGPYDLPRAAVVDDEVLRIFQGVGLDAEVLASSQVQDGASYVTGAGRHVRIFDMVVGDLGHPPLVSIHQPTMERSMVGALDRHPSVELRWATSVEAIDQAAEHVDVQLRPTGGGPSESIRAAWAVACDGAPSPVRCRLRVPFDGFTFAQRWLVVDGAVDRPLRKVPHPLFVGDAERPIVTLPMSPGRHRWEWMLHPGEDAAPFLEEAAIRRRMARWLDDEHVEIERAVVYTFHARIAERWRVGRVLLAGDAAHVMPPFAGQGFSSGARDAANLAWKLDAVLRGAPARLLDSYEAERRPHVAAMQRLAVRLGGVVQTTQPARARVRDRLMDAFDGSRTQRLVSANAKPLPTYGTGAFAQRPHRMAPRRTVGALFPQPEVRLPGGRVVRLDDALPPGWVLLTKDRVVPRAPVGALRLGRDLLDESGAVEDWLRRAGATWVLLRPDRFVFACGPADAVAAAVRALGELLGPALTEAVAEPERDAVLA